MIAVEESPWGATIRATRPSRPEIVSQFGMPNIFHARGVPDDPEVQYREFIAWWVPHDDDRHTQFTISTQPKHSEVTPRYQEHRAEKRARQDLDREAIARALLDGSMTWAEVDATRVNMIFLQDDVAQGGSRPRLDPAAGAPRPQRRRAHPAAQAVGGGAGPVRPRRGATRLAP